MQVAGPQHFLQTGTTRCQNRAMKSVPAVEVRGLVKRWPRHPTPVLNGVDLVLAPSTIVAVQGRNGAGKTTLLRVVAGILAPDQGSIEISGIPATRRRAAQSRIGFVSAGNGALYGRLTIDHHLDFCSRLALLPRERRAAASAEARRAFALDELRDRRVDRLSTGQRQRLRLALAFLHEPSVVLLDEPESSLDGDALALLSTVLDELKARGGAAIICSPTGTVERLRVDRMLSVHDGRLVEA